MQYLLLFLEGIITFISPCLLPLLPVYISFFAAGETGKRRTLCNALAFILGFTVTFVVLGAFAGAIGRLLVNFRVAVDIVSGLIVIILGLNFTGIINLGFLDRLFKRQSGTVNVAKLNFISSFAFGIVFSVSWTPCAGAFLGSALMMASAQGGAANGSIMLAIYSLGLGIPFFVSAVLIDRLKGAFGFIKRNYRIINAVSGIFLLITGILMATGLLGRFLAITAFGGEFTP